MDVFGTAITAVTLIYGFLDACSAFSEDAKSLAARFKWDLVALEAIREYFHQLGLQNEDNGLSEDHEELLKTTSEYLDGFADKVHKSFKKIERENWVASAINRTLWIRRQKDLEKMQAELQYWTDRFGVRVLALPQEVRNVIQTSLTTPDAPPMVRNNQQLLDFTSLSSNSNTKKHRAKEMFRDSVDIAKKVEQWGDLSFIPLPDGDGQVIFATRAIPSAVTPNSAAFDTIKYDVCVLAAALNHLSPSAGVRLLKVEYCFYHEASNQFLLAQILPYPTMSMMTLGQMIRKNSFPQTNSSLGERLKLAYKLAEAVVFLHAAGFLHKNITSSSAVALHKARARGKRQPTGLSGGPAPVGVKPSPLPLDEVYLMGFDLVRGVESRTSKEGVVAIHPDNGPSSGKGNGHDQPSLLLTWDREIYMHPERLRGDASRKYEKAHDVYSLGVVLLEVGLWEPLSGAADRTGLLKPDSNPETWQAQLKNLATEPTGLTARVGRRYCDVVEWCLDREGDDGIEQAEFVQQVLDPLEEISRAVS